MKILALEDHSPTRDLVQQALEEAGHTVAVAGRCDDALSLALEGEFDLAVLDVMLPDGSGIQLCQELRRRGLTLPILFLTARGEVEDRVAGLDAGGDDYLRKPFAIAELRARVRALGRRRTMAAPGRLQYRQLSLDFDARRMVREGQDVALTAREWAVLEALAENLGRVVPRTDILAAAWPGAGPGSAESLDVIMSRLRRKLRGPDGAMIRTVRGEGLILEPPG